MTPITKIAAALAIILSMSATSAFADTYHHIDQLALSIDRETKQLVNETRHYRHSREYRHLQADARDLSRLASHMHDVAHAEGSLHHLQSDLAEIDSKFHHLESVIGRIEHEANHGHGHIHGHTSHVHRLLGSIENSIHHLQDDLRSLQTSSHTVRRVVVTRPTVAPVRSYRTYSDIQRSYRSSHGAGHHGGHHAPQHGISVPRSRGISFGNGRFSINF
ncbi:hypothetical protein K227x_25160 [Rubripirellula lacrimiformis]|uniref:Chromosome partition protein Smc n=1 Tax=Rubripirellula lacrimiformis TaxID=1930273 RepID=A0A517NAT5_9BACT|nr:hypothetical protein [Rubripirellula lacrimiformis]QDT04128.1 hypothetical protein K227x_25160 [Rubripirellula lacrimiformis]